MNAAEFNLGRHCGITFARIKPASLFTVREEDIKILAYFAAIESSLSGKKIGLFGSYEWADGEWMRTWQQRVESAGGVMIADGVTEYGAPDSDALSACRALGEKAAK